MRYENNNNRKMNFYKRDNNNTKVNNYKIT